MMLELGRETIVLRASPRQARADHAEMKRWLSARPQDVIEIWGRGAERPVYLSARMPEPVRSR